MAAHSVQSMPVSMCLRKRVGIGSVQAESGNRIDVSIQSQIV